MLLKNGANPDSKMLHDATPLYVAIEYGKIEAAKLLVKHGANINAQDDQGNSLLSVAARQKNNEGLRLLIANHALSELKNQNGRGARYVTDFDG